MGKKVKLVISDICKIKGCAENRGLFALKLELGDFGDFGDSNANWNANGRRTFARMCSIGNLVMHFLKSLIFHDT